MSRVAVPTEFQNGMFIACIGKEDMGRRVLPSVVQTRFPYAV